uniref:Small ribosomal subunit protein uS14 n=1 Tax=Pipistrellus kuhlii TaxID=59472 RepID=A0A7J7QSY1_PIPKU|nr:ribosomal protein S29 [Pipistrellus kuhlii]
MGHQQLYWSHPRKFGQGSRSCRVCSNRHGLIRKYGLNMCRQCFRQYAKDIGFIKVRPPPCPPAPAAGVRRSWEPPAGRAPPLYWNGGARRCSVPAVRLRE